jgi:hypothetical protein
MRPTTHEPTATHHGTTHERRALRSATTALKALFWCAMAAEVGWLVLAASAGGLVASALDRSAQGLVHLVVLTALAPPRGCSSCSRGGPAATTSPIGSGRWLRLTVRPGSEASWRRVGR